MHAQYACYGSKCRTQENKVVKPVFTYFTVIEWFIVNLPTPESKFKNCVNLYARFDNL